jgi:hypothetical protein
MMCAVATKAPPVARKDHISQQGVLTDFMKQSFNAKNSLLHCPFSTYRSVATEHHAHHEAGADGVVRAWCDLTSGNVALMQVP